MNNPLQRRLLNSTMPHGTCASNSAFVTLIANESYVSGALCLKRSLMRVRSACPIVLVVADPLPADAMAQLESEYDSSNIRRLSALRLSLDTYEQWVAHGPQDKLGVSAGRRLQHLQPAGSAKGKGGGELRNTRQLHRAGGWAKRTHQKLLLFALGGYRRMAFLDIDMLVTRNIDALLDSQLIPASFAAVAALPYSTSSFNSGVFVFEPSLATAAALDDLSRRATFRPVRSGAGGEQCWAWRDGRRAHPCARCGRALSAHRPVHPEPPLPRQMALAAVWVQSRRQSASGVAKAVGSSSSPSSTMSIGPSLGSTRWPIPTRPCRASPGVWGLNRSSALGGTDALGRLQETCRH